jgi:hypothetical protein
MTSDCLPSDAGRSPGNLWYLCAGFSGMGFEISPAVGLVMIECCWMAHSVSIRAFHRERFAEGKPIRAEYEYLDD